MQHRARLALTAIAAASLLALAASAANATRLQWSSQTFRIVWSTLTFFEPNAPMTPIVARCPVTLEGSFHSRTISKVSGALIGYVTRAMTNRIQCAGEQDPRLFIRNGTEVFLDEKTYESLPWHIRYDSFTGTLPTITGIRIGIVGMGFLILDIFHQCLFLSTAAAPAYGIFQREAGGVLTGFRADETSPIPLNTALNGRPCPNQVRWMETGAVTVLNAATRIGVALVA